MIAWKRVWHKGVIALYVTMSGLLLLCHWSYVCVYTLRTYYHGAYG